MSEVRWLLSDAGDRLHAARPWQPDIPSANLWILSMCGRYLSERRTETYAKEDDLDTLNRCLRCLNSINKLSKE